MRSPTNVAGQTRSDSTPEQAKQALSEAIDALIEKKEKLRNEVIQKIGELVLVEMESAASNLIKDSDDVPSAVAIFGEVRKILDFGILGNYEETSGPLLAVVWEQYVRIYPDQEPFPEYTEATRWRCLDSTPNPGT